MSAHRLLIVTDGLISDDQGYTLSPDLHPWRDQLNRCAKHWFKSQAKMPIQWYAMLANQNVSELVASSLGQNLTDGFEQVWIASPFHAQLGRDQLRVMPDAMFPWSEADAHWLCELLNPLLQEEGMKLIHYQGSPLLLCKTPLKAAPLSFANISGFTLPDRHPEGRDGGKLMRLMAEVQMLMHHKPADHRRKAGEPDVDGLWLWSGGDIKHASTPAEGPAVATRNPLLRSLIDAKDAEIVISEAGRLSELFQVDRALPEQLILAGREGAVLLRYSMFAKFGKRSWKPKNVKSESALFEKICSRLK